jgi:hypothetical protein
MDPTESLRIAKRIVLIVSRNSPHWQNAWDSAEELVALELGLLREKQLIPPDVQDLTLGIRVMAKERWCLRTFIVFDMFHDTYNPDTAHLPGQDDLPVISVFLGKSASASASIAGTPMKNKVNSDIRAIQNATGPGSRPPFVVDHADGKVPFYTNPRTCKAV